VEEHSRLLAVAEAEAIHGEDLDQILRDQAFVGVGLQAVGRPVVLVEAAWAAEEARVAIQLSPVRNRKASMG